MIVNPELYEEGSACFDPTQVQYQTLEEDHGFSQTIVPNCTPNNFSMEDQQQQVLSYSHQDAAAAAASAAANMELEFHQQMGLDAQNFYNQNNNCEPHLMQDHNDQPNWETHQDLNYNHYQQIQEMQHNNNNGCSLDNGNTPYPPTQDLLNLFHLPNNSSSMLPNSSISFTNPTHKSGFFGDLPNSQDAAAGPSVLYDPMFHLNLPPPPPPPMFRELFQSSFPQGYNISGTRNGTLFDGMEDREGNDEFSTGVLEFSRDLNGLAKGKGGKNIKHFATEKQRRVHLNDKYDALKKLVPISTKPDRASIVGDAIDYIKELQRTVNELQILVEKKRYSRERLRRTEDESVLEVESKNTMKPHGDSDQAYNGPALRSSWLQRKSKNTEVDVRIIDDEVTIKLVQQKRINSLLFVSKVLDELQLDLQHVAGGLIGDFYSFLFNTKIYEGSSVYASAIANKLIDVVDKEYAASQPTTSY